MKTPAFLRLVLTAALLLPAAVPARAAAAKEESATAMALKKVADRYALTKKRIATMLDGRLHPAPLPAALPNPFYRVPETPLPDAAPAETVAVPDAPDVSDADTLGKFVAGIRISGLLMRNDSPRLTINSSLCKVGDVIPAGTKDHPVYIQILKITEDELTLGLNEARQTVRLRR